MNRLGLFNPDELTPAQNECYDMMKQYTTANYGNKFTYLDTESRLVGPFGIHLHYPEVGHAFINVAKSLRTIPNFPAEVRECAILGVGCRLDAAYEQYAHNHLSGFSEEEQKQLHAGQCPENFSRSQKVAFSVALKLGNPGPLPKDSWDEAVETLGRDGAAALVFYVGFYSYVSTVLNGFDAVVPE